MCFLVSCPLLFINNPTFRQICLKPLYDTCVWKSIKSGISFSTAMCLFQVLYEPLKAFLRLLVNVGKVNVSLPLVSRLVYPRRSAPPGAGRGQPPRYKLWFSTFFYYCAVPHLRDHIPRNSQFRIFIYIAFPVLYKRQLCILICREYISYRPYELLKDTMQWPAYIR